MARLRAANPDRVADLPDAQLRDLIVSDAPTWRQTDQAHRPHPWRARTPEASPLRKPRSAIAAGGLAVIVIAVTLTFGLAGSTPSAAQAFPVLKGPSALTPSALQHSLKYYGVSANNDGLNIAQGRAVNTPWGSGYVLTGPDDRFVCLVAPGLTSTDWGASCAQTGLATSSGTAPAEYAYESATHTARLVKLLPSGATATMQIGRGPARQLRLSDGVLAVELSSPAKFVFTIKGHMVTEEFSPQDAGTALRPG